MVAERLGAEPSEILINTGLTREALNRTDLYVTLGQYKQMMFNACRAVPDPTFYLQYGSSINLTEHGKLGHAAFSSASFEDALKTTVKYIKILNRMYSLDVEFDGGLARLTLDTLSAAPELYVCEIEQIVSAMCKALKNIPYDASIIKAMYLKYPAPGHADRYPEYFDNPIYFNSTQNCILFYTKPFKEAWSYGDPMIEKIAQKHCDDALRRIESESTFSEKVREVLLNHGRRFPNQEQVAEALNLTTRTLARNLQKENTSFQEQVDLVRRDIAIDYLNSAGWSVEEIAELLGYSSAANFGRAFKKWTGKTPSEYRLKH